MNKLYTWFERIAAFLSNPGLFLQLMYLAFAGWMVSFCFNKIESFKKALILMLGSVTFGVVIGYFLGKFNHTTGEFFAFFVSMFAPMVYKRLRKDMPDQLAGKVTKIIKNSEHDKPAV